jgi:hypothetical protein
MQCEAKVGKDGCPPSAAGGPWGCGLNGGRGPNCADSACRR